MKVGLGEKVVQLNAQQMVRWCLTGLCLNLSTVARLRSSNKVRPEIVEGTLDLA